MVDLPSVSRPSLDELKLLILPAGAPLGDSDSDSDTDDEVEISSNESPA